MFEILFSGESGHYMFIEAANRLPQDRDAVLMTMKQPPMTGAGKCITFWYATFGISYR